MKSCRFICIMLVCVFILSTVGGCGSSDITAPASGNNTKESSETHKVDFPAGKPITLVVGFNAGAITDLGCRIFAKYLGEELNTTITVVNEPGASGWVSWLKYMNHEPDGYLLLAVNDTMNFMRHNPSTFYEEGVEDFQLLACQVIDISSMVCRAGETRFTTFEELIDYAKKNEVTVSVSALGTEDAIVIYQLNKKLGTKFTPVVAADGSNAGNADLLGGHVDLISNNVAAVNSFVQDNQMKPLVVFNETRSVFWPDVPTYEEIMGEPMNFHSARGIMMPKGGDPEVVKILIDACKNAITNPKHIEEIKALGLETNYRDPDEFYKMFKEGEDVVLSLKEELGW